MKVKTVKVDRTIINLKAISISDYDSEEYQILLRIMSKILEEERKKNIPIMDVKINEYDAQKLFPKRFLHNKKVLV